METHAPVRYFDRDFQVDAVKILPGQYFACGKELTISTVLGSCVSTCLWDPVLAIGGMNHFMLPGAGSGPQSPWGVSARFGVYAMEVLINDIVHLGGDRRRLVAKVFGGARVLKGFGTLDVGSKNSEFVLEFLKEESIPILAQDLLGVAPRKVHFFPATGTAQVKKLHLKPDDHVLENEEREYMRELDGTTRAAGDIEIFRQPK
jgi:chemotaxis protein CheD